MKILIAPNSFKECASSVAVSRMLREFLSKEIAGAQFTELPLSDGGDGFYKVCRDAFSLEELSVEVPDCIGEKRITVPLGYNADEETVYIESADVFGLKTIAKEKRDIGSSSSFGLGRILKKIYELHLEGMKIKKIVIGLGGSAINDFGMGVFVSLGGKIISDSVHEHNYLPNHFPSVTSLELPKRKFPIPIELVLDVESDLTGGKGTTLTFAKQKGASDAQVKELEIFGNFVVRHCKDKLGQDFSESKIGASGGVALGLGLCADVTNTPAKEFILDKLNAGSFIRSHDIIITGEGSFDKQSMMNKATGVAIEKAIELNKQVIVICGKADTQLLERIDSRIICVELLKYFDSVEKSIADFGYGLELGCKEVGELIKQNIR